jgi:hypothetical protein
MPPPKWHEANRDYAHNCTPAACSLKPGATSRQIGVRSRWLHGPCSLGQGTAATGPVAVGRLAQPPLACIPRPGPPTSPALNEATTNRLVARFLTAVFGIRVASHSSTGKPGLLSLLGSRRVYRAFERLAMPPPYRSRPIRPALSDRLLVRFQSEGRAASAACSGSGHAPQALIGVARIAEIGWAGWFMAAVAGYSATARQQAGADVKGPSPRPFRHGGILHGSTS